ncbi:mdj1 protein precursor [Didymosphaeria variabile]|uniref:Mdj1 protein n=1 Tax=Didymosphaeria variabile TaxID=1932322 RepID=A0A9W9C5U5_9PLEO|nr:mdj1 protein precursor [Didymosphaeria variabile]KAJ4346865.1 mdj1 protein precursor [Didymosphaeria variabile]
MPPNKLPPPPLIDHEDFRRIKGKRFDGHDSRQAPIKQKTRTFEHHPKPEVIRHKEEKHMYLPDPEHVMPKNKVVERHLKPPIIRHQLEQHVYLPDPVVQYEHKVLYEGGAYQRSTVEYQKYGESSQSAVRKAGKSSKDNRREEYESDASRKGLCSRKGKHKRRTDETHDDWYRRYSQKEKGKQIVNRHNRHKSSLSSSYDHKRSTSPAHVHGVAGDSSRAEHARRPQSRSLKNSRRGSPRRRSHHRDDSIRSEHSSDHESQTCAYNEDDDDAYYGSNTDESEREVPQPSSKKTDTAPKLDQMKVSSAFDPYAALGLQEDLSSVGQNDIKAAYRGLIKKWHPDSNVNKPQEEQDKAAERTADLNRAYDILADPAMRNAYDRTGETELYKLEELAKRDGENEGALVRHGRGGGMGLKNFFDKK